MELLFILQLHAYLQSGSQYQPGVFGYHVHIYSDIMTSQSEWRLNKADLNTINLVFGKYVRIGGFKDEHSD